MSIDLRIKPKLGKSKSTIAQKVNAVQKLVKILPKTAGQKGRFLIRVQQP